MEERIKHSKRIRRKKTERVRSVIAKELVTNPRYRQKIIKDKRGKEHDLDKLSHAQLIKLIQEDS
jgi:hypothetical protein